MLFRKWDWVKWGGRVEGGRATVVITEEIYKRKIGIASSTSSLNYTLPSLSAINSRHCSTVVLLLIIIAFCQRRINFNLIKKIHICDTHILRVHRNFLSLPLNTQLSIHLFFVSLKMPKALTPYSLTLSTIKIYDYALIFNDSMGSTTHMLVIPNLLSFQR